VTARVGGWPGWGVLCGREPDRSEAPGRGLDQYESANEHVLLRRVLLE
jgi:hypothetical protein